MGGISRAHDFTLEKYGDLCDALLNCGYSILTVHDYLTKCQDSQYPIPKCAIMRHDVDRKIDNALRMAKLEHAKEIRSTYYFRYPYTFKPEIINQIRDFGHEIGYHYEVLAKAKGDYKKAMHLFEQELQAMREFYEISTICMHGSPLSRFDNRDLWKHYDFKDFGIVGEAYLSMAGKDIHYFTDTGRNWGGKHSVRDAMPGAKAVPGSIVTTDDLTRWIASAGEERLYLTVHPERWAASSGSWVLGFLIDLSVNVGKRLLQVRSK